MANVSQLAKDIHLIESPWRTFCSCWDSHLQNPPGKPELLLVVAVFVSERGESGHFVKRMKSALFAACDIFILLPSQPFPCLTPRRIIQSKSVVGMISLVMCSDKKVNDISFVSWALHSLFPADMLICTERLLGRHTLCVWMNTTTLITINRQSWQISLNLALDEQRVLMRPRLLLPCLKMLAQRNRTNNALQKHEFVHNY